MLAEAGIPTIAPNEPRPPRIGGSRIAEGDHEESRAGIHPRTDAVRAGGRDQQTNDYSHLGAALESREAVDALAEKAGAHGMLVWEPVDEPYPVGYYCGVRDPDGILLLGARVLRPYALRAAEISNARFGGNTGAREHHDSRCPIHPASYQFVLHVRFILHAKDRYGIIRSAFYVGPMSRSKICRAVPANAYNVMQA
jgi:hypothetical protein